jgi:5-methylcytosine-specific restriction endonuclease McrA
MKVYAKGCRFCGTLFVPKDRMPRDFCSHRCAGRNGAAISRRNRDKKKVRGQYLMLDKTRLVFPENLHGPVKQVYHKTPISEESQRRVKLYGESFYTSEDWLRARYSAFKRYGRKCCVCGAENTELHVDHIKPRSLHPELELDIDNLQIMCRDCNIGKKNTDSVDWRIKAG